MDKKDAEAEAIKKAKDAQAAAGKNSGMSGRDLVNFLIYIYYYLPVCYSCAMMNSSLRTTRNGLRTRTTSRRKMNGILRNIGGRRSRSMRMKRWLGSLRLILTMRAIGKILQRLRRPALERLWTNMHILFSTNDDPYYVGRMYQNYIAHAIV